MKVLAILEVDEDQVLNSAYGENNNDPENTVENAVEIELGWVDESGISVFEVLASDSIPPNDADLGALIRPYLKN